MLDNARKPSVNCFKDAKMLLDRPEELRARAGEDGYLFFRDALDKTKLLEVRKQILLILSGWGLLDPEHDVMDGMANYAAVNRLPEEDVRGFGVPAELYRAVQSLESFHALAHETSLINIFRTLFRTGVFPHPRNIARLMLPHEQVRATPPHQDFIHIQGAPDTWTAWFPLGDCPRELGGLSMLEGSQRSGVIGVIEHQGGAGGLESILCDMDLDWADDDYRLGDVIIFHSCTVHRALPNRLGNRIRLSCDFRYQPVGLPVDPSSLQPHGGTEYFSWKELYEGWSDESLQYYWKSYDLDYSQWDESIRWQKEKIC